jgi:DNA-binding FrmR family transcriptional regulator
MKFMSHTIAGKKKLFSRVRRIKGQSLALEAALEGEPNCMFFLQQVAAIKGSRRRYFHSLKIFKITF